MRPQGQLQLFVVHDPFYFQALIIPSWRASVRLCENVGYFVDKYLHLTN